MTENRPSSLWIDKRNDSVLLGTCNYEPIKQGNGLYAGLEWVQGPNRMGAKIVLMARTEDRPDWSTAGGPPHFTILGLGTTGSEKKMTIWQHIPTNKAAYQIHDSGGAVWPIGGPLIQVTVAGVKTSSGWWFNDRLKPLSRVLEYLCSWLGIPLRPAFQFKNANSSASVNVLKYGSTTDKYGHTIITGTETQRQTGGAWSIYPFYTYGGIVGHQHAPFDTARWGPGQIDHHQFWKYLQEARTGTDEEPDQFDGGAGAPGTPPGGEPIPGADEVVEEDVPLVDSPMDTLPFKFNPPLHRHVMPKRVDFGSGDPAGTQATLYLAETGLDPGLLDAKELQNLRLGRIVQHERAAGFSAKNEARYGFRFLYNPASITTTASRNASVIIDPQSTIGAVVSGINQNFQTTSIEVFLNRTADVLGPTSADDYYVGLNEGDLEGLKTYGTHWDLEYLYRLCNGIFNLEDRGRTGDLGVIIPSNARLILGKGRNHFGFVESISWVDQMFSVDMVPILTKVGIVFRRHVDMTPDELSVFWDAISASGIADPEAEESSGSGGGTGDAGGGEYTAAPNEANSQPQTVAAMRECWARWGKGSNVQQTTAVVPNSTTGAKYHQRGGSWKTCGVDASGNGLHTGHDYSAPIGTVILAPTAGLIKHTAISPEIFGSKQFLLIPNNSPGAFFFAHCASRVADGMRVNKGATVGSVGKEGNVSGPHLHLEWWPDSSAGWSCSNNQDPVPVVARFQGGGSTPVQGNGTIETIYGYRANDYVNGKLQDHSKGLAMDVMVINWQSESGIRTGTEVATWAMDNQARLKVKYIIWRQKIWNVENNEPKLPPAQWRGMEDRGDPNSNHMNHVHISFLA